ncbi:MAG: zinc ribbon domain-containing protein [Thaumarchaeota archaeon]|nr:zinc ribbon domain-containing protein [Nitrososphaerota archaeon]
MASKLTAALLTIVGGFFYAAVGGLIALATAYIPGGLANNLDLGVNVSASFLNDVIYALASFGIISGALIMVGGFLLNSDSKSRRRWGGMLALIMMVLGAIPTLGGFVIGFILTLVGAILGLSSKSESAATSSPYLATAKPPQTAQAAQDPDYTAFPGRTNYCSSCGARLRDGSIFCSSCGAKVPT